MNIFSPKGYRVTEIDVERIELNPYQPRKLFDQGKLNELALSIKEVGLLQPLIVRKKAGKAGYYELIAGERRLRAAKIAGLKKVAAIIRDFDEDEAAQVALIENLQREDLNPVEEAMAFERLLHYFAWTQQELAQRLGKSQSAIANKIRLLKLPDSVLSHIALGRLTERHGRALLQLDNPLEMEAWAEEAIAGEYSVAYLQSAISEELGAGKDAAGDNAEKSIRQEGQMRAIFAEVEEVVEEKEIKKPRRVVFIRDVRIFVNTILKAFKTMQDAGIAADMLQEEEDDAYIFHIRVPK